MALSDIARSLCFDYLVGAMRRHDRVNCERQRGAKANTAGDTLIIGNGPVSTNDNR